MLFRFSKNCEYTRVGVKVGGVCWNERWKVSFHRIFGAVWCVRVPFYEWVKECIFYFKSSFIEKEDERGWVVNGLEILMLLLLCRESCFVVCQKRMSERICRNPLLLSFFQKLPSPQVPRKVFCYR